MKTATVTSAGGVVLDDDGNVLMIARRSPGGDVQWTLPKGLVEKGENPEETAVREVAEETGVTARIIGPPSSIDYWFVWKPDDTRYHKFVRYYPMRATPAARTEPDGEAEAVEWVSPENALERASFRNEQQVLREMLGESGEAADRSAKRAQRAEKKRKRTDATRSSTPKAR